MHKISELLGKPIVTSAGGEKVGNVSDVLIDSGARHIVGLVVSGGLLRAEHVLPFAEVQTLGRDAIVARTSDRLFGPKEWRQQSQDAARASALRNRRVLTSGGRHLGVVGDIHLNDDGTITALEVSTPALGGLRHKRSVLPRGDGITIGADAVLVTEEAAPAVAR